MPLTDPSHWTEEFRRVLSCYDESLLRQVAAKLVKPRSQWPAAELIDRCLAILENTPVIDRRLKELEPIQRQLLALIGHSRQSLWKLGSLVELAIALGQADGLSPILHLCEAGLLCPQLPPATKRLKSIEHWLGQAGSVGLKVFAHPVFTTRALGEELPLPALVSPHSAPVAAQESDGLEWPLRLCVLWQLVSAGPLRRTQQGEFFKRDLERLSQDSLLVAPAPDQLVELPDPALLAVGLGEIEGIIEDHEGELRAGTLPPCWQEGLPQTLASLWAGLPQLETWGPMDGWRGLAANGRGNPIPSAGLLILMLLARLPADAWADPADLESWLLEHHPYWTGESVRPSQRKSWIGRFLLGIAYPLRLVQAAKVENRWLVRLSAPGRWLLGLTDKPPELAGFPKTLTVQPNLEVIAYRQGLTPKLAGELSHFAAWKTLGAACLLQLQPESVYRALQAGLSFTQVLQILEQHGMKPVPQAVIDALKTWTNKRERITVYPSATLFEFTTEEDLNDAIARGLPGTRISDRLAVVASEAGVDFRHYRLAGTRDYLLPPEKCVSVGADGVSLSIDLMRSDLLVEAELLRFAEPAESLNRDGRRHYRLTPASLGNGREGGWGLRLLEEWFVQRTGEPLPPAARLLINSEPVPPLRLQQRLVLQVATPEMADGLLQWPETRGLIEERLGPTMLAVSAEHVETLRQRLQVLKLDVRQD